jgi:hypothetical protein
VNYLIISRQHGLLPFANRLRLEGHQCDLVVWKHRYEKAWEGSLVEKALRGSQGEIRRDILEGYIQHCEAGEATLLTDVSSLTIPFANAKTRYHQVEWDEPAKGPIRVGGWFDGEALQAPHLLVFDMGAWPGGLGAYVPGGCTLIAPDPTQDLGFLEDLCRPILERLKAQDFKGLVNADLEQSPETGEISLGGAQAGWPFLHTHAFLSELEGFGEVLSGGVPRLPRRFTVAIPVSIPPWPNLDARGRAPRPIEGLTEPNVGQFFWHDVVLKQEDRSIRTAGLDGLVGVARGSANTHYLAKALAVGRAQQLRVEEKQFRLDVSDTVPQVLASLEHKFGLTL